MTDAITVTKLSAANPVLAAHARAIHRLAQSEVETIAEYCVEVGRHLREAHQHAEPKVWFAWIDDEFGWAPATAIRFIRAYTSALEQPVRAHAWRKDLSPRSEPSGESDGSAA
jgi:hypothetical protein